MEEQIKGLLAGADAGVVFIDRKEDLVEAREALKWGPDDYQLPIEHRRVIDIAKRAKAPGVLVFTPRTFAESGDFVQYFERNDVMVIDTPPRPLNPTPKRKRIFLRVGSKVYKCGPWTMMYHVRGFIDGGVILAHWSKQKKCWFYRVEGSNVFKIGLYRTSREP